MSFLSVIMLGIFLGVRHAVDSDHVVAVTSIVSQQKRLSVSALIGAVWGIGHMLTIFFIGSAIIYFKIMIPEHVELSMEFLVGMMIVILGMISFKSFLKKKEEYETRAKNTIFYLFRPLFVGVIHGMAGSAAVTLLVLNAISDIRLAMLYLLAFGLGTVLGMMITTLIISLPYIFTVRFNRFNQILGFSTSVFSIVFGIFLMYKIYLQF